MADLTRVSLATGIELDVWDTGPRDAPAIIFLHGFPENHRTWRHQIAHFSGRYRCIAPDQRGYGNSSKPEGVENYSVETLVGDIFALTDALQVTTFTIAGHDWGGALAWLVAVVGQAQGKVSRAIIANAPHPTLFQRLLFTDADQRRASQYMRAFRDPANDALVEEHGLPGLLQSAMSWENRPQYDPVELQTLLPQWTDPATSIAMLNWYRASAIVVPSMEDPLGIAGDFEGPTLPRLEIPTMVVWGMKDEALLPANVDGLGDYVSDLSVIRIDQAGHFVPWEAPAEVNEALDGFLPD